MYKIYVLWQISRGVASLAAVSTDKEVVKHKKVDLESIPANDTSVFVIEEKIDEKMLTYHHDR